MSEPSVSRDPASTEAGATSTTVGLNPAPAALQRWLDRSTGRLATYTSKISCLGGFCGTYSFTELGAELVEVVPIDGHPGFSDPERWTLTGALRQAAGSNGNFTITETDSTLTIAADPELNAIDDEWQYTVTDIVLSEPPEVLPTGSWKWLDVYGEELPPLPVPDDWQGGFAVPSEWQVRDLDGSYGEAVVGGDSVNRVSGVANPGTCGGGQYSVQDAKVVFLGDSPINPPCPPPMTIDLSPNDAVWIRPANGEEARATSGHVNGLDVSVLQADWYDHPQPNRTVELLVRNGDQSLRVSLGVGIDSSTARAVLRSFHAI